MHHHLITMQVQSHLRSYFQPYSQAETSEPVLGWSCLVFISPSHHLQDWHFDIESSEANKETLLKHQLTLNLLNKGT